ARARRAGQRGRSRGPGRLPRDRSAGALRPPALAPSRPPRLRPVVATTRVGREAGTAAAARRARAYVARSRPLYTMLLPALACLALFHYYPMYGVTIAFRDYNPALGFAGSPWVGLQNFEFLLALPDFRPIFLNTLVIAVGKLATVQLCAV